MKSERNQLQVIWTTVDLDATIVEVKPTTSDCLSVHFAQVDQCVDQFVYFCLVRCSLSEFWEYEILDLPSTR